MRKELILSLVFIFILSGCSQREYTFLEQEVINANDYSMKNQDDLEIYQTANNKVSEQEDLIKEYQNEYESGSYTIDDPYILVNPFDTNNLTAFVAFESDEKVSYSYTVEPDSSYPFTYTNDEMNKGTILIPVVGLFEDQDNTVEFTLTENDGMETTIDLTITTETSPSNYQEGSINVDEAQKEMGVTLTEEQSNSSGTSLISVDDATVESEILDESVMEAFDGFVLTEDYDIYDLDGNLRFSTNIGSGNNPLKLSDGKYLTVDSDGIMYEMDYFGRIYQTYVPPVSEVEGEYLTFHHDATISSDGKTMYALAGFYKLDELADSENADKYMRETMIFKYDRETGELIDAFDYSDIYADSPQSSSTGASDVDPIHMNSIEYVESANELIISAKNQSMVIGVNPETGDVDWMIKDPEGVSEENEDLLLDVVNEDTMVYPSGNHTAFPMYTDEYMTSGDDLYISVFDNRNCVDEDGNPLWTTLDEESVTCADSEYSSMIIYHVNLADMTVETMEEIIPDDERWSYIRSSVYTNVDNYYQINYADMMLDDSSTPITHSDLYVTDLAGEIKLKVTFDGMSNEYRTRMINEDEIAKSLQTTIDNLK